MVILITSEVRYVQKYIWWSNGGIKKIIETRVNSLLVGCHKMWYFLATPISCQLDIQGSRECCGDLIPAWGLGQVMEVLFVPPPFVLEPVHLMDPKSTGPLCFGADCHFSIMKHQTWPSAKSSRAMFFGIPADFRGKHQFLRNGGAILSPAILGASA